MNANAPDPIPTPNDENGQGEDLPPEPQENEEEAVISTADLQKHLSDIDAGVMKITNRVELVEQSVKDLTGISAKTLDHLKVVKGKVEVLEARKRWPIWLTAGLAGLAALIALAFALSSGGDFVTPAQLADSQAAQEKKFDEALEGKADLAYVDQALADKVGKAYVDQTLAGKADRAELEGRVTTEEAREIAKDEIKAAEDAKAAARKRWAEAAAERRAAEVDRLTRLEKAMEELHGCSVAGTNGKKLCSSPTTVGEQKPAPRPTPVRATLDLSIKKVE